MNATRCPLAGGFTLVEILAVIAALAIVGSIGVVAVSNVKSGADSAKLASDVDSINRSIQIYQSAGGSLSGLNGTDDGQGSHSDVLTQLKTKGTSATLGVTSSALDARVYAVYQTTSEASSSSKRAVWNSTANRFQIASSGSAGVKEFRLNEDLASSAPAVDSSRTSTKQVNAGNGWEWNYTNVTEVSASTLPTSPQTGLIDSGLAVMGNLGLDTGSWTVGPSGKVTFGYGYREAGYQSRLALFDLTGMDIYDLTTDAGRKAFLLEALRRIMAGGTRGQVVIDASNSTPGSSQNTFTFNPGAQVGALLIPNTDIQSALAGLASDTGTLADYSAAHPQTSPLVSVAKYGTDIPSFYSKQFAMLGANSNTYAVEDMITTTSTTADYQDMVFTTTGMTSNGTMNTIANPTTYYTSSTILSQDPGWTWDKAGVSGSSKTLHSYLQSVNVVP